MNIRKGTTRIYHERTCAECRVREGYGGLGVQGLLLGWRLDYPGCGFSGFLTPYRKLSG